MGLDQALAPMEPNVSVFSKAFTLANMGVYFPLNVTKPYGIFFRRNFCSS